MRAPRASSRRTWRSSNVRRSSSMRMEVAPARTTCSRAQRNIAGVRCSPKLAEQAETVGRVAQPHDNQRRHDPRRFGRRPGRIRDARDRVTGRLKRFDESGPAVAVRLCDEHQRTRFGGCVHQRNRSVVFSVVM
ncbi:MAG: hypothetical protein DMF97_05115 [Acidobacteria bacterium]|nr:MAG: hypothetical protein DMF97_05115 [Acidobacteriota bacterium]